MSKLKLRINQLITKFLNAISPKLYFTICYFKHRGHLPNFKNPKDLSEIVISQILSGKINQYSKYVDKIEVRQYIEEWGWGEYLPKIYGTWDKPEDIEFDSLPNSFALKTNHGCGKHYICKDKSKLDKELAIKTINDALNTKFGRVEKQYSQIKPRCFAEEYIDDGTGNLPLDYKFMTCDGEIKAILICVGRSTGIRLGFYDLNWKKRAGIRAYERYEGDLEKPKSLEKMIEIAQDIAKKFPQVRVDLYCLPNGKIYFGELTFTPEGGLVRYFTNEAVTELGHNK